MLYSIFHKYRVHLAKEETEECRDHLEMMAELELMDRGGLQVRMLATHFPSMRNATD